MKKVPGRQINYDQASQVFPLLLAAASTTPEISFAAAASSTGNDKFLPLATENEI